MIKTDNYQHGISKQAITTQLLDYQREINRIQSLVDTSNKKFNQIYQCAISNFIDYYATCRQTNKTTNDSTRLALTTSIEALQRRRAYLLPLGGNITKINEQHDAWTYATFVAAMTYHTTDDKLSVARQLLSEAGQCLLESHRELMQTWQDYLRNTQHTIFSNIIHPNHVVSPIGYWEMVTLQSSIAKPLSLSDEFLLWLKSIIDSQKTLINSQSSFIHGVEDGIFLTMPTVIEKFINAQNKTHQELTHSKLLDALKQQPGLIYHSTDNPIHQYCWGDWQKCELIQGIILKINQEIDIWNIAHNPLLIPDPLAQW